MKRWQTIVAVSLVLIAVLGCKGKNKPPAAQAEQPKNYESLSAMDTGNTGGSQYPADPYASDTLTRPLAQEPSDTVAPADASIGGGRTHTVAKGDTLYSLARKYYGNQAKWKTIWEANKARVPDPNRIPVGTKLVIP